MGIINRIIKKQPNFVKKIYYNTVPFKFRYGKKFRETTDFLEEVEFWGYENTKNYQFDKLREILKYSKDNVPYYGKLFSKYEFNTNIQCFDDVKKLPLLTKEIISQNFDDLISKKYNGKKILFKTSGSTGKRLEFYGSDDMFKIEAAYILHSIKSHGGDMYDEWTVWIRRHSPKNENDLIVLDYELKRIYMSPFHLNDENIFKYVDIINKSKSKTIFTYPSTAYWFSCLLEKYNLKLPNVKSVHGASEQCLDVWSKKIKEVFGFNLKMHYGSVEKVSFAYQSNYSDFYHESLTYSYSEILDNGVLVGTSFMNMVMPFIRYETNDIITKLELPNYNFSNPLTFEKIDGRVDDMVVSSNGTKIPSVNFYTAMSKFEDIKMFQIHQNINKELLVKIVVNNLFTDLTLEKLSNEIINRVGNLPLQFEIVDEIYRNTNTGKIRCVTTDIK